MEKKRQQQLVGSTGASALPSTSANVQPSLSSQTQSFVPAQTPVASRTRSQTSRCAAKTANQTAQTKKYGVGSPSRLETEVQPSRARPTSQLPLIEASAKQPWEILADWRKSLKAAEDRIRAEYNQKQLWKGPDKPLFLFPATNGVTKPRDNGSEKAILDYHETRMCTEREEADERVRRNKPQKPEKYSALGRPSLRDIAAAGRDHLELSYQEYKSLKESEAPMQPSRNTKRRCDIDKELPPLKRRLVGFDRDDLPSTTGGQIRTFHKTISQSLPLRQASPKPSCSSMASSQEDRKASREPRQTLDRTSMLASCLKVQESIHVADRAPSKPPALMDPRFMQQRIPRGSSDATISTSAWANSTTMTHSQHSQQPFGALRHKDVVTQPPAKGARHTTTEFAAAACTPLPTNHGELSPFESVMLDTISETSSKDDLLQLFNVLVPKAKMKIIAALLRDVAE